MLVRLPLSSLSYEWKEIVCESPLYIIPLAKEMFKKFIRRAGHVQQVTTSVQQVNVTFSLNQRSLSVVKGGLGQTYKEKASTNHCCFECHIEICRDVYPKVVSVCEHVIDKSGPVFGNLPNRQGNKIFRHPQNINRSRMLGMELMLSGLQDPYPLAILAARILPL
ncbi:hypothetical protein STEG23_020496 [Scotinomys teguina]